MGWTQTDVDILKAAIASGTKTVAFSDKTVTYQDTSAMLIALRAMEAEAAGAGGSSGRCTLASTARV